MMQFGQQTSSDPFSGRDSFRPAKFFMNAVCQIKNAHFRKIVTKRFDIINLSTPSVTFNYQTRLSLIAFDNEQLTIAITVGDQMDLFALNQFCFVTH